MLECGAGASARVVACIAGDEQVRSVEDDEFKGQAHDAAEAKRSCKVLETGVGEDVGGKRAAARGVAIGVVEGGEGTGVAGIGLRRGPASAVPRSRSIGR